ncbi:MAG: cytochrome c biogenesis protein ResB [Candidatus Limnocylindrales bacterium]
MSPSDWPRRVRRSPRSAIATVTLGRRRASDLGDPLARTGLAIWRTLSDVRFAVVLIIVLAVAGLVGTMVRQIPAFALRGNPAAYATEMADLHRRYDPITIVGANIGPTLVDVFEGLGLFRVFTAPWFTLLLTLLIVSIVVCTIDRTPRLWRGVRQVRVEQPAPFFDARLPERAAFAGLTTTDDAALAAILRRRRFKVRTGTDDTAAFVYGDRNQYFKMATLFTHLGLILFLIGGAVTGAFGFETAVFVGESQTAPVQPVGTPGNLLLKNLGFEAPTHPDGSFADFRTDLAVYRDGRQIARKTIRVNDPLTVDGYVFHQNSFGAAETLDIRGADGRVVWSGPVLMDSQLLDKPQGFLTIPGSALGLFVVLDRDDTGAGRLTVVGTDGSIDASGSVVPVFADQVALGGSTDPRTTGGYEVTWRSAGAFTGIVVRNDPGQPLIWFAFLSLISGIVLSFYFPRRRVWLRRAGARLEVAMLADRYVDVRREFTQLVEDVGAVTGRRPETTPG